MKPTREANDWLPGSWNFPAIDPDRKEPEMADTDEDFEDEDEVLDEEANWTTRNIQKQLSL